MTPGAQSARPRSVVRSAHRKAPAGGFCPHEKGSVIPSEPGGVNHKSIRRCEPHWTEQGGAFTLLMRSSVPDTCQEQSNCCLEVCLTTAVLAEPAMSGFRTLPLSTDLMAV